ncbi:MAG: transketolase [Acidobacteria bacterium]|nr:transketolase [Acidobacteriota bacterium]MBU4307863.1 transketolase [Acidobacteriota bacterium]MCG2811001.1 transketolase [Candidatus Aminicenantes bacterium]
MNEQELADLSEIARQIRIMIIQMIGRSASGHPGGSLSAVEILTWLYFREMNIDPQNPGRPDRDRFVLSKGHAAPVLYATLAKRGFFSSEILSSLRQVGSSLQGHPHRLDTPGVDASTGSLGQGLSMAAGMAMGLKLSQNPACVYAMIGDGESQEGQIWEAAMTAGFRQLTDLCVFLDYNDLQIDGRVSDIKDIQPLRDKWQSFRWRVHEINGHDFREIAAALAEFRHEKEKPTMIIARTVKGKGVSFMENNVNFHGQAPNAQEMATALTELNHGR